MVDPRGPGRDRRSLIIIDGRNYTRPYREPPSPQIAQRIAAKRIAFEYALVFGELVGVGCIVASIVLLAVAWGG